MVRVGGHAAYWQHLVCTLTLEQRRDLALGVDSITCPLSFSSELLSPAASGENNRPMGDLPKASAPGSSSAPRCCSTHNSPPRLSALLLHA